MASRPMIFDHIVGAAIICAVGFVAAKQTAVLAKDFSFYRSIGWDLSRDSGNKLFLLEALRQSVWLGKCPTGYLRLLLGIQCLAIDLLLIYGAFHWITR